MFTKRFTETSSSSIPKVDCEPSNYNVCHEDNHCSLLISFFISWYSRGVILAVFWCIWKPKYSRPFPSSQDDLLIPGALWLCPYFFPCLSLSLMYQGIFLLPWNVFLLFYNTLFVDQWPFSVALLQFRVYLSLILAIKSFAFETELGVLSCTVHAL